MYKLYTLLLATVNCIWFACESELRAIIEHEMKQSALYVYRYFAFPYDTCTYGNRS